MQLNVIDCLNKNYHVSFVYYKTIVADLLDGNFHALVAKERIRDIIADLKQSGDDMSKSGQLD